MNRYERQELMKRAIQRSFEKTWFDQLFCLHYYVDTGCIKTAFLLSGKPRYIHLCVNCGKRKEFSQPQIEI